MADQPRPSYARILVWLSERHHILDAMITDHNEDEDWFEAGTNEAAKAKIAAKILGIPKQGWVLRHLPYMYLGVMVGVNQIHVGERMIANWHLPDDSYPEKERKEREQKVTRYLKGLLYTYIDTYRPDSPVRETVIKLLELGETAISYSINYDRWTEPPFGYVGAGKRRKPKQGRTSKEREQLAQWEREHARSFPFDIQPVHS